MTTKPRKASKSSVVSMRFEPGQVKRLARKARQLGRSISETGAMLIEEGLRQDEFGFIDFRDSIIGREAYIQGSTLGVWEVVWIARGYGGDAEKAGEHLRMSPLKVQAALNYAVAYPGEIDGAIEELEACDFASLKRMLPQAEIFPRERGK